MYSSSTVFFLLYTITDIPATFWKLARAVLSKLCHLSVMRIDFVLDTTKSPSIKEMERDQKNDDERFLPIKLTGPNKKTLNTDFNNFVKNDTFKQ